MGVEWGGNGWPVLKSADDVAREEAAKVVDQSRTSARNEDESPEVREADPSSEGEGEA